MLGYAYAVPTDSIPERYDESTSPSVTEPAFEKSAVRHLIFHKVIDLTSDDLRVLGAQVGRPIRIWFFEGKIVSVVADGSMILPFDRVQNGLAKSRIASVLGALGCLFLGVIFVFWTSITKFVRKLFVIKSVST